MEHKEKKPDIKGVIKSTFYGRRGQSSVEFVLVLPLLFIVMLIVSQLGYLVYIQNTLEQAAREATRIISTTNSNSAAHIQVFEVCRSLDRDRVNVWIDPAAKGDRAVGDTVRVTVVYRYGGLLNFLNSVTGRDFLLKSESIMRMESN